MSDYRTGNSGRSASATQPASTVWFISFGDLLTLLLCFFLVLTPWGRLSSRDVSPKNQTVTPFEGTGGGLGTTLAGSTARETPRVVAEIPLFEEVATSDSPVARALLLAALEDGLRGHLAADGLVMTVVACSPEAGRQEVVRRVVPLALSPEFARMSLRIELLTSCAEARILRPTTRKVVGTVRVTRT